ncbi:hypothetical protein BD324DRAFT_152685 [Kockovaella imperatae]|uniref:N-acetyltransferase domain-containing protein n=1 Tax=Kockovaella imperatae TaxID=4999 RepID=A0A1Y1U8X8_9TREE|nr:hypothetical protein BD324DRAFT_152685 [Kockovaella imperatae]ORX34472.1 hypothetical protein BD324DRAFT_152685 [Kockovaella imperatae]
MTAHREASFEYLNEHASDSTSSGKSRPYRSDREAHANTPAGEYDFNWCFGRVETLRSSGLDLRPLVPSLYASAFVTGSQDKVLQDMYHVKDIGDVLDYLEWSRQDAGVLMFAIFADPSYVNRTVPPWAIFDQQSDPTASPGCENWAFSGVVGIYRADLEHRTGDIGIFLWAFARGTGISLRASALATRYAMTDPSMGPGLGMNKLRFATAIDNTHSRKLGERLGAHQENPDEGKSTNEWIAFISRSDWESGTEGHITGILST